MSGRTQPLKRFLSLALLLAALVACGQGGTEVGNPNQPSGGALPNSAGDNEDMPAAPSLEGPTPTPSPQSFLIEETQEGVLDPEENINPSETIGLDETEKFVPNRWGLKGEEETPPGL